MNIFRVLLLLVMILVGGGCTFLGMAEYAVAGPPVQKAQYKLKPVATLVIAENYQSPSAVAMDADRFGAVLSDELRRHTLVPEVIDSGTLYALRERKGETFTNMKVSEIGRELGAQQVVYVDMGVSEVEQAGGGMMRGKIGLRLKVIDCEKGETLWPVDMAEGFPVSYQTPMARMTETETPAMLKTELIDQMAVRTARLFYDWKPVDLKAATEGQAQ